MMMQGVNHPVRQRHSAELFLGCRDEEKQQARCICAWRQLCRRSGKSASPTWVNWNTVNCRFSKGLWSKGGRT